MATKKKTKIGTDPQIRWTKANDPLKKVEELLEEQHLYAVDELPELADKNGFNEEEDEEIDSKEVDLLLTSMGGMVLDSSNNLYKLMNFWNADTNFSITQEICDIIEEVDGVEVLAVLSRYRFRMAVGRIFQPREVMHNIQNKVYEYVKK